MLIAAAAVIAATPGITVQDLKNVRTTAPVCQQVEVLKADASALFQASGQPATRKLTEEPAADAVAAVLYTEGQCIKPVVVSRDVGANPKRK